jgi:hypothetical protein
LRDIPVRVFIYRQHSSALANEGSCEVHDTAGRAGTTAPSYDGHSACPRKSEHAS